MAKLLIPCSGEVFECGCFFHAESYKRMIAIIDSHNYGADMIGYVYEQQ